MAQLILIKDNGEKSVINNNVADDILAVKVFYKNTLQSFLRDKGFEGTDEEAGIVTEASGLKEALEEIQCDELNEMSDAIDKARCAGKIHYYRETEQLLEENGCELITCKHCVHCMHVPADYCSVYAAEIDEDDEVCDHFYNTDDERLSLCYMDDSILLPIIHTNRECDPDVADILCLAKQFPFVQDDVIEMENLCEDRKRHGCSETIKLECLSRF